MDECFDMGLVSFIFIENGESYNRVNYYTSGLMEEQD